MSFNRLALWKNMFDICELGKQFFIYCKITCFLIFSGGIMTIPVAGHNKKKTNNHSGYWNHSWCYCPSFWDYFDYLELVRWSTHGLQQIALNNKLQTPSSR
jgi:hypothetical protein